MDVKGYNPVKTTKVTGGDMSKITAPLWIEQQAWATLDGLAGALGMSRSALIEVIALAYQQDAAATIALLQQLPGRENYQPKRSGPGDDYDYSARKKPQRRKPGPKQAEAEEE